MYLHGQNGCLHNVHIGDRLGHFLCVLRYCSDRNFTELYNQLHF
jgi:hypothetical protein